MSTQRTNRCCPRGYCKPAVARTASSPKMSTPPEPADTVQSMAKGLHRLETILEDLGGLTLITGARAKAENFLRLERQR